MTKYSRIALASLLVLGGCAQSQAELPTQLPKRVATGTRCAGGALSVDTDFASAALSSCTVKGGNSLSVLIAPENEPPINCSPWYAFRVSPAAAGPITVRLSYTACGHRYQPKYSYDGKIWHVVDPGMVSIGQLNGLDSARFLIESDGRPIIVSAQEIMEPETYRSWYDRLEQTGLADRTTLGKSAEGRNIEVLRIGNYDAQEVVVLIGRQHPPEVTGAIAMMHFVDALAGYDEQARHFRDRFQVVAIPLLNPDGVVHGYWRHNSGGMDLNRDWGPFTQPETRLVRDFLEGMTADSNKRLRLFLDFHSTRYDTIYTLTDEQVTDPVRYKDAFLADYAANLPNYVVRIEPGHNAEAPVFKGWAYQRFKAPSATYEIGDETDRALIRQLGDQAARSMMTTLLETPAP